MQVSSRALRIPTARLYTGLSCFHSFTPRCTDVHQVSTSSPPPTLTVSPYDKNFAGRVEETALHILRKEKPLTDRLLDQLRVNVHKQIVKLKKRHGSIAMPGIEGSKATMLDRRRERKEGLKKARRTARTSAKKAVRETGKTKEKVNVQAVVGSPVTQKMRGGKFWTEGWGEDKLSPRYSASETDDLTPSFGVLNVIRSVDGIIDPTEGTFHLYDLDPPTEQRPIPRLAHNLDRALFNPGVNWLQDPRSRVFNYTPWLENIPRVQDFDFSRVSGFIKSSKDEDLFKLAKANGAKFAGSTSSLTGMLSQIYFALSNAKEVDTSVLSRPFFHEPRTFTPAQRFPTSIVLWYRNGIYSTDSYSYDPTSDKNVLTWMGTMLEKFLTLPEPAFKRLLRSSPPLTQPVDQRRETCRYAKVGSYVMRSQLDCQDPRLPGTGIFDIKTRASLPIRLDLLNYEENSGYLIRQTHGTLESFEREYYDLIRSAFLKYSFQARIGNMDGVLVAYHNTARIFGFQYVPLEEMDERLFGNKLAGPYVFEKCVKLLEVITEEITHHFPEQHIACIWEADPDAGGLYVWAEPLDWEGDPEQKPIVQLTVKLRHFLDDKCVSGDRVVGRVHQKPWFVHYQIMQSGDSIQAIRTRQQAALEKQRAVFDLPNGVSIEQMAEVWEATDFGGVSQAARSAFTPERFRKPRPSILALRKLAQRGKEQTDSEKKRYANEPMVIWEPSTETFYADVPRTSDPPADDTKKAHVIASTQKKPVPVADVLATLRVAIEGTDKRREGSHYEPPRKAFADFVTGSSTPDPTVDHISPSQDAEPPTSSSQTASDSDASSTSQN